MFCLTVAKSHNWWKLVYNFAHAHPQLFIITILHFLIHALHLVLVLLRSPFEQSNPLTSGCIRHLQYMLYINNIPQTGVSPAVSKTRWLPFFGKSQVFVHCASGSNTLDKRQQSGQGGWVFGDFGSQKSDFGFGSIEVCKALCGIHEARKIPEQIPDEEANIDAVRSSEGHFPA